MEEKVTLKDHVIKWGGIIAAVNILMGLIIYIVDYTLYASMWLGLSILVIFAVMIFVSAFEFRKGQGGFIDFRKSFLSTFLTFVIAGFAGVLFNVLLFGVIDPEMGPKINAIVMEKTGEMMEGFGASAEDIDKALADAEEKDSFAASSQLKGFFFPGLLIYVIFSSIIALVVKKSEPVNF